MRGFAGGYVHAPLMDITEEEKQSLRRELQIYL
jgi:hypothetical protein